MVLAADHIDRLGAILGPQGLLTLPADTVPYESAARYEGGRAAFVARPASTEAVSQLVAYCVSNAISLVPQSGNTGLVGGSTPDGSGTQGVVSLDRLRSTFSLDTDNMTLNRSYVATDPVYFTDEYVGSDTLLVADVPYENHGCTELTYEFLEFQDER